MVTLSAVYIAGMVFRSDWWRLSILTLTYLIFAGATTAAILSRERRAFFVAFATFGLAYGLCIHLGVQLVTDRLLMNWARTIYQAEVDARRQEAIGVAVQTPPDDPFADVPSQPGQASPFRVQVGQPRSPFDDFEVTLWPLESIGHSFFAVLIGFVAGVVAEAVVRRKSQASSSARSSGTVSTLSESL